MEESKRTLDSATLGPPNGAKGVSVDATRRDAGDANRAIAAPDHILQFFGYQHLPVELQAVSALFYNLAHQIVARTPCNPERTVALRKLLESKDAAVRAAIAK